MVSCLIESVIMIVHDYECAWRALGVCQVALFGGIVTHLMRVLSRLLLLNHGPVGISGRQSHDSVAVDSQVLPPPHAPCHQQSPGTVLPELEPHPSSHHCSYSTIFP